MTWLKKNAPWLKWLLAISILGALLYANQDGLRDLSTRQIGWSIFAAALGVRFCGLCLTFLRWWLLVTGIGLPFTVKDAFRLGLLGEGCNLVGPGAVGGDLVKAISLAKDHPGRRASASATVLLDRVLGMWALFIAGALASLVPLATQPGTEMQWAKWVLWGGSAAGLIGITLMLQPAVTHSNLMHWLTTWRGIGHIVKDLMDSIALYQGRPRAIFLASLLSLFGHVAFLSSFYLCAAALHGDRPIPGFVEHLVGLPLPEAVSAAVPTPGGIGALEAALGWFYKQHQLALDPQSSADQLESAFANGLLTALAYRMTALFAGAFGIVYYFAARKELAPDLAMPAEPSNAV
jgi:hypothetical protein